MSTPVRRQLRGFTLVELLVVVSIIALLLSILMPSLSRAKELARVVTCKSNLHQQGVGMQTYVATYGAYPGHCGNTTGGVAAIWPTRIRKFASGNRALFNCPSQPDGFKWQTKISSGGGYAQQADVTNWSYELGELILTVGISVPFAYSYNDWGASNAGPTDSQMDLGGQKGLGGDIRWGGYSCPELKADRVRVPGDMIAIGDNKDPVGGWHFNLDPTSPSEYPGTIHSGGSNILYADGHTTWKILDDLVVKAWDETGKEIARHWNNHNWWNAQEKGPGW